MVQQIAPAQIQPTAQQQTNQTPKADQSFQSVLKQSTSKLGNKTDGKTAKSDGSKTGTDDKKIDSSSVSAETAAMSGLPGSGALVQNFAQAQPAGTDAGDARSVLSVSSIPANQAAANAVIVLTGQTQTAVSAIPTNSETSPVGENTSSNANLPQIPQNQVIQPVSQQSSVSLPNQTAVVVNSSDQTANVTNIPTAVQSSNAGAAVQNAVLNTPKQESQPVQQPDNVPQAISSTQTVQSPSDTKQTGTETEPQAGQSTFSDAGEKKDTGESAIAGNSAASFPEMMQTGNVIIKISDSSSKTEKTAGHQVADKVYTQYKAGNSNFQMDLYPKELGKVTVKLAMQNGTLSVEISALNPKTQSMLLSNSGEIRTMLENAVSHPVEVTQPSQDAQWYQQDQNSSHQNQQEKQQQHYGYRSDSDDTKENNDDFLSVIQQLRIKANMA